MERGMAGELLGKEVKFALEVGDGLAEPDLARLGAVVGEFLGVGIEVL